MIDVSKENIASRVLHILSGDQLLQVCQNEGEVASLLSISRSIRISLY